MDVTIDLISLLSESDRLGFVDYLKSRNKRPGIRNIDLFKKLLAQKEHKLKEELGSNAYNVLKKRLTDNLLDYVSIKTVEQEATQEITIIRMLLIARKLFAHQKKKSAFYVLKKAERLAETINHYSLLNEIYQTAIESSYGLEDEEHDAFILKFEENRNELVEQGKLNLVYSTVRRAYAKVEKEGEQIDLQALLNETYSRFNISNERGYNFKSLFQIAQLADLFGATNRNYYLVDTFFEDKISELAGGQLDSEKYLIYHIDLLYLMANIYFRKRNFKKSLFYLDKMRAQMLRFDKRFYKKKKARLVTLRALNLNYQGDFGSAEKLLDVLIEGESMTDNSNLFNSLIARMMVHFQQNQMKEAKSILSQLTKSDSWYEKRMGHEWLLYKNFAEILLHVELNNLDYADSRLVSLKRKLAASKTLTSDNRINVFLKWIEKYTKDPSIVETEKFKMHVEGSIEWRPREQEDIFMISFYAWLKSKMEKRDIYKVTLELVSPV